jgi:predicted XRE-type DNA-binding protein
MIGAMNIQNALNEIRDSGLTENEISAIVDIPQPTINRLRRGVHQETSYIRTVAIQKLAKEIRSDIFGK